jgi:hypothetical protein
VNNRTSTNGRSNNNGSHPKTNWAEYDQFEEIMRLDRNQAIEELIRRDKDITEERAFSLWVSYQPAPDDDFAWLPDNEDIEILL